MPPLKDRDLVETIIKSIVESPDDVIVNSETDDRGLKISVRVAPHDMGRVIGVKGSTIEGIRCILRSLGHRQNVAIGIKIEEPEGSTFRRS